MATPGCAVLIGGGGTRLLAAAPDGGEEAEPAAAALPAQHRSLRTGISGGSPGASVAGPERGRGRRPLRSALRTAGPGPPPPPQRLPAAPPRAPIGPRGAASGAGPQPIGRGARASSRQARRGRCWETQCWPSAAGRSPAWAKRRSRRGLAAAGAVRGARGAGSAEPGAPPLPFVTRRHVAWLPFTALGPLPACLSLPTASGCCRERSGGTRRGPDLRPTGR